MVCNPENKQTGKECSKQNTHRGQHQPLDNYRFHFAQVGIHTTRKQNDIQSYYANKLGNFGRFEFQSEPVGTCQDTD